MTQQEQTAIELMTAAAALGQAIQIIDDLARTNPDVIEAEAPSADTALIEGERVMMALRTLAMRLDRAAVEHTAIE